MSDGYVLRGRLWLPHNESARRACLYLHGIQSHGGWFEWSAGLLAKTGGAVILPDRRGSGLNPEARGDTPAAERWLADLDELADWTAREFGVPRLDVVGVSWGGKLAAAWAVRRPQFVTRLLLIAPGISPIVDLPLRVKFRVAVSLLFGPEQRYDIPLNDPALFTDDAAGRRFIADDPLKLTRVSARFLYCSRALDRALHRAPARSFTVPIALVLAGRDRIICNERTEAWVRRVASEPPVIVQFTEAAHTLEFEAEAAAFADWLSGWAAQIGSVSANCMQP